MSLTCVDYGALGGTRTPNLLIRSQMLYPLSYERWRPTVYDTSSPAEGPLPHGRPALPPLVS
jgi:hypothetical protein